MKISYAWLKQLIELSESPKEIGNILTSSGLEVESIAKVDMVPGGLEGLVIGQVLTCEKHPEADKLSLTTVDIGTASPLSIVCGAPNVLAGQKVVVALVGATLYPTSRESFTIKRAKIRGAISEGMICSAAEIGLETSQEGILVLNTDLLNGTPAAQYFGLEADYCFEIGLTPNRADAASHLGVARDLKAVLNRPVRWPSVEEFRVDNYRLPIQVSVQNAEACPRYAGLTIDGLTITESPDWLKRRLLAIGLKPINNVVDVTNYVCHELGQPLHAFDVDQIVGGAISVCTVPEGTPFVTLDGIERNISATDLMICNAESPMCIAGVFGGQQSGVTTHTKRIFLESAHFSSIWIRKTSQRHGLKTDASFRFERGTDPNLPVFALKRAALLIQEVAGGVVSSEVVDLYPKPALDRIISVCYRNIDRLIGIALDRAEIQQILENLDIRITDTTGEGFMALVPPYRVDVEREVDVIEEIVRVFGLDTIPLSDHLSSHFLSGFPDVDADQLQERVSHYLVANGFYETITNSLVRPALHDVIRPALPGRDIHLLNPLSGDLSVMRQTLLFSGLETLAYNLNRRQKDLKIFEFGKIYHQVDETDSMINAYQFQEQWRLGLWMTGNSPAETWRETSRPINYHDLAEAVQQVLALFRVKMVDSQPANAELFQYGLTYCVKKEPVVMLGLVQPRLTKQTELKQPVFYADFNWQYLLCLYNNKVVFEEVSRFPEVRRDLSLVLDQGVTYDQISQLAHQIERKLLRDINVFDVYEGESVGEGKKSYSISFTLQDAGQTLNELVIDKTMQRLMMAFERELGAIIRK